MTLEVAFVAASVVVGAIVGACWVGIVAATRALYDN